MSEPPAKPVPQVPSSQSPSRPLPKPAGQQSAAPQVFKEFFIIIEAS